jgi:hypothetical protein
VQSHSKVVRIPPGESVVLNSAERAPYLLVVEVLHGDLHFEPSTRVNKELLTRVARDKPGKKGIRDAINSPQDVPESVRDLSASTFVADPRFQKQEAGDLAGPSLGNVIPPTPDSEVMLQEQEEGVDLVEQLFGANLSVRDVEVDLADSYVLPAPPKNKVLDLATWERTGSVPNSPALGTSIPSTTPIIVGRHTRGSPQILSSRRPSPSATPPPTFGQQPIPGQQGPLTLEDYSNRMEAAAVMLAQLNANLVREPVTGAFGGAAPTEASSGTKSWIPGSGWITGTSSIANASGPEGGVASSTAPSALRARLQPSEAAAIRERIMQEMMALEEERMTRTRTDFDGWSQKAGYTRGKTAEDEGIVRRELNKADPSAAVFQEVYERKKGRIRHTSPYGHLANWDVCACFISDPVPGESHQWPAVSLCYRQDGCGFATRNTSWPTYPRVCPDMEGGELRMLGQIVSCQKFILTSLTSAVSAF